MTHATAAARSLSTDADEAMAFANAALALAGHEIADPYLNELFARQARGEISGDVARELGRKHILGR
ncbi:hypothetical protein [Propionimicrobium sp. PCR01-08-3]|uniref:hypothetical protein n=1 Tax=Propionimicrobium sp. PCR01-08-3 TaxID=3052086 RepID=UPI00255C8B6B|nr:hypothetical protein [Propionimicrobium sp. PCR01-08-3]WIY82564.1 hypothetical protein QQ658_13835 [Propionimicrobium sp. PCR01-08-3]